LRVGRGAGAARRIALYRIHLVPVLLGDGIRFFSNPGIEPINLETISVAESGPLTDLRFRVVK
jgi:hypothetical protein